MKISVDLSLYPLNDDYLTPIKSFILKLQQKPELEVVCNSLSTQIFGEFDPVCNAVNELMRDSFSHFGQQVLVAKYLNGDRHPARVND